MKFAISLFILTLLFSSVPGQPSKPSNGGKPASASKKPAAKAPIKKDEKVELDKALAVENAGQKAAALETFLADFPASESRAQVIESLTAARVAAAQNKLDAGDRDAALKLVRKAVDEAPVPYPEKLFTESIARVPMLTFSIAGAATAYEVAALIEKNSAGSAAQQLTLANFYLSMEDGSAAKRLAEAALKHDEKSAAAYLTLGMANRLNFDIEASAAAYEKAVELDPESIAARQGLAEMKRAIGKPDEALTILSALLEKDPNDIRSLNGRILSLFAAGKRAEAEAEFAKAIEAEPGNFVLLAGAAYWYAANGENAKAVDLAGKAITAEPRYIWSHIALARGLAGDGRFIDAEQVLLKAKKFGNFPTLDYELASIKFKAGFYREAAEELQKSFTVKDGAVVTKLGRRIERSDTNFIDLLLAERRASILEPKAADDPAAAEKLRALLEFSSLLSDKAPDEVKLAGAAAAFADGTDKMRFHRQMYAANQLAGRALAPSKVLDLTKAAVGSVEEGLSVPLAAAPVMASELYASRMSAIASDKYVLVPDVPKQTLSAIARGRIELLAGIALMQQESHAEAVTRFRRAVSILPEKSAWWRSSYWQLGTSLEADGKDKEAVDAYAKSYTSGEPDAAKYSVIENVYKRANGGTDGLEALIGANPATPEEKKAATASPQSADAKAETVKEDKAPIATEAKTVPEESKAEPTPEKKIETSEVKPADVPPTQEKELPKAADSPSPQPETNAPAAEKTPEQKPKAEEVSKSGEPGTKPEEIKPPTDDVPPLKAEVKKTEDADAAKSSAVDESKVKPPTSEQPKPETKEPAPVAEERKSKAAPSETKVEEPGSTSNDDRSKPKLLFEPVVIEVKSGKPARSAATASENPTPPNAAASDNSGASRARLVAGHDVSGDVARPCTITASENSVSLARGKGVVGILVGVENGEVKDVKHNSSSPHDVDIAPDTQTPAVSGKTLFIVRSISEAAGEYKIDFTSPCGKKELPVYVR